MPTASVSPSAISQCSVPMPIAEAQPTDPELVAKTGLLPAQAAEPPSAVSPPSNDKYFAVRIKRAEAAVRQ